MPQFVDWISVTIFPWIDINLILTGIQISFVIRPGNMRVRWVNHPICCTTLFILYSSTKIIWKPNHVNAITFDNESIAQESLCFVQKFSVALTAMEFQ